MNKTLNLILAAITFGLAAVCVVQWQKLNRQGSQLASLRGELSEQTQKLTELQAAQTLFEQQRRELLEQANQLAANLQVRQRADAGAAARPPGAADSSDPKSPKDKHALGNFMAQMMDDPETRELIREQQRLMLEQLYGPLIKRLGLTPEEAEQFKNLLADNAMKSTEMATSLMGASSTNRVAAVGAMAGEQKAFEEQVRDFLGETRYAQYQDYQQTVGERTQLSQFQQQFAGGENALTGLQTEQLLQFMKEEKQHVAAATGQLPPGPAQDAANLEAMLSGGNLEQLLQNQETANQRVYDRAVSVLSEDQLAAFGKFQTNQLQMMRMGMNMAKKFMSPEQPVPESPAPARP